MSTTTKQTTLSQSVQERRKALEDRFQVWPRDTIAGHFRKACAQYKDRPYIYINDEEFTYGEVWDRAVQYAKAFIKFGVKRRDHIAVLMNNDSTYPSLMIASSNRWGGIYSDQCHACKRRIEIYYFPVRYTVFDFAAKAKG